MNRNEALEEVVALPSAEADLLRARAETDLFFFAKAIMRMKDMYPPLHIPACRFLEDETKLRKLFLMPRGTLKSSFSTVANNARRALRNPEVRIMIANEVFENASDFVGEIMGHFEQNKLLRALWPHVIPDKFAGAGVTWGAKGATVVRKGVYKEPTWFPIGVGGAVTSKHFNYIDIDDMIGLAAFESAADMAKTIRWNRNIEPLVIGTETIDATVITWTGTRWHNADAYNDVIEMYGDDLAIYHQGCYTADGKSVFPSKLSLKFLDRIAQHEPDRFAAQYLNDPTSGMVLDFDYSKIRTFLPNQYGELVFITDGEQEEVNPLELDRIMTIDPNAARKTSKDEFAIGVTGQDKHGRVFSLEDWGGRPLPDEASSKALAMYKHWRPRVIGVEEGSTQNWIHTLSKYFESEGIYARFEPLKPENKVKEERIRSLLQPMVAGGLIFIPSTQVELRKQIKDFPGIKNDDRIDRFAYAMKLHRMPMTEARGNRNRSLVKKLLNLRSTTTGY